MFTSFRAASFNLFSPRRGTLSRKQVAAKISCDGTSTWTGASQWALRLAPLLLLFVCLQARAGTSYSFPGNPPPGCQPSGECNALTLAAGDSISVAGPTSMTVNGDFVTGASAQLNAGGLSANLTITVSGITYLGDYTILDGTIIASNNSTGTITTGANSQVIGDLITTTAGVINVGTNASVVGDLDTKSGAINVGDNATITGSLLSSLAGAITVGVNAKVTGTISSTGDGSGSGAGAITVGGGSIVNGGISTNTGAITVEVGSKVGGNISTNDGAITVATQVNVGGSVCTGNSGAITIGASANVGGNVETANAGAITVGTKASVAGDVTVEKAGAKTIAPDATVGTSRIGSTCGVATGTPTPAPRIISRDWRQLFMR